MNHAAELTTPKDQALTSKQSQNLSPDTGEQNPSIKKKSHLNNGRCIYLTLTL
ncbi:hypothetical protein Vi05172_g7506 [Venturia inaequalis]|nr:hypothetical protein Vi05172_g7506 [Venturia inaequalis]